MHSRLVFLSLLLLLLATTAGAAEAPSRVSASPGLPEVALEAPRLTWSGAPVYRLEFEDERKRGVSEDRRRLERKLKRQKIAGNTTLGLGAGFLTTAIATHVLAIVSFQIRAVEGTGTAADILVVPILSIFTIVELLFVVAGVTVLYIVGGVNLGLALGFKNRREKTQQRLDELGVARRHLAIPRWRPAIVAVRRPMTPEFGGRVR